MKLKQIGVRFLLVFLRALIVVKRVIRPVFSTLFSFMRPVGQVFLRALAIPLYRLVFFLKRSAKQLFLPAKNKMVFLLSNRWTVHLVVVCVVLVIGILNIRASVVRAESFGEQSILFGLLRPDDGAGVEVVTASDISPSKTLSYTNDPALSVLPDIDFIYLGESYALPVVGDARTLPGGVIDTGTTSVAVDVEREKTQRATIETYVVKEGDTLGRIAALYDLSLSTLLWANNLTSRSVINPGHELSIPPIDGVVYTVRSGDTLAAIANTYKTTQAQITAYNGLGNGNKLSIGQKLILPEATLPAPVARAPRVSAPVASIFRAPTPATAEPRGSSTGNGNWVWPTDWRVITQYYGWSHTGIDIDGDYNTNSYAASDGTVIYSGWRSGYGITVEVDHGGGLVTRYAHHSKNYVRVGDVVTSGQPLAQTGTTGRSTGTHLHFEVIKNGKFQNPFDYVR